MLLPPFLIQSLLALSLGLFHLVGPVPTDLGLEQGALAACPSPAHCARESWPVADPEAALQLVLPVLLEQPRVELVEQQGGYVHATASSALFGFVDDVELYADPDAGLLQARSVSRLGDSDLGVNAKRLALLQAALTPGPGA
ncbi:DUF1499 domain-containing protein [Cyanobium sp. LEGE 06143]|jgi:uncharacterized protein (DUF1499 family)|uniref:DUF1499 domain-containing protein n=1 Tax=unclassified Cyanobium TaxID=2627006 RepID=UPI00187DE2CA|nr:MULTISPECIES: DUF1499 domain-containing protein [unclassified Cyanobium]MBE9154997.1 DUF1499 domain-containing protein [Cyanobium sp. LEGE 06113]MBE9172637.1 DUF1499 domain-containing protein [Cyanobium sp. LEGE 06143]